MKAYKWSEYSKSYCSDIKLLDSNVDKTLCIYEAFNETCYNTMYFLVYKDKVIIEDYIYNTIIYKFFGMIDLLNHLKEEGEIK